MGGGPGGPGITPGDANSAAEDARNAATTDQTGINAHTADDHRVEVNNSVCHSEEDCLIEIKGAKGENKIGGFLEFVGGLKHSMIALFKTTVDASYSKTFNLGPYTTEMAAAKYEVLGTKKEKVFGTKSDTYTGWKYKVNKGNWLEARVDKLQKEQAAEKELNNALTEYMGSRLEATAAKHKAKVESLNEKINTFDLKVASQLRVQCEEARMKANELNMHLTAIKNHCGKWERQCKTMDESIGALMEIKGSKQSTKGNTIKLKAGLLKFTASVVKLGE